VVSPTAPPKQQPLSAEAFRAATDVSRETLDRLDRYAALLERWNRAINLIARGGLADLWRRHMLDSAQLWPLLPLLQGRSRRILDLGSGAGFPGLVLAIMGASEGVGVSERGVEVHLVEVDRRKAAFLREAARITGASVTLHVQRIESLVPFPVDAVTARACAPLPRLLDYAAPFLRQKQPGESPPIGLFLKGRDVDRELTEARKKWKMQAELVPSRTDVAAKIVRIQLPHLGDNPL
jgi:16S rRNA (guanine527-N7)-methyltransferase